MGFSSNILWHQTSFANLKKILQSKSLRFAYSLETIKAKDEEVKLAFPMISLCDLPIGEMADYIGRYGKCSIAFTREWAIKNQFNPVWYCDSNSYPLSYIIAAKDALSLPKGEGHPLKTIVYNILGNTKNIEGPIPRHNYKTFRFYDEREYRLTPTPEIAKQLQKRNPGIKLVMDEAGYNAYKGANKSPLISDEKASVSFTGEDIYCIMVDSEYQISQINNLLNKMHIGGVHIFTNEEVRKNIIGIGHNVTGK